MFGIVVHSFEITSFIIIVSTIEDYTGQWQITRTNQALNCVPLSTERLDCSGHIVAYKKSTGKIFWSNGGNKGSYDGKDTVTWTNGVVWKRRGMAVRM